MQEPSDHYGPGDLVLVSVDDHLVEPADLFDGRLARRHADRAPRVVELDDGSYRWVYDGMAIPNIALNAVAGRPSEENGFEPTSYEEIRAGCYDVEQRVMDMSANGQLASMCFPSFPGFAGPVLQRPDDKDLALAVIRAYNDWHIDAWAGSHPDRFIPLAVVPWWDPEVLAAEVRRVAAKGCHAITFSENPEKQGFPSLHSDHWDALWGACSDEGTIVCLHIGSSSQVPTTSMDAPIDVMYTLTPINIVLAAADVLLSRVMTAYPGVRFALSEGGIGWVPYFLERADFIYRRHRPWTGRDFGGRLPSDVFRERILTCFIEDYVGLRQVDDIGVDRITWECDYPHGDTSWPGSPEALMDQVAGWSKADVDKITHLNAMREFRFDPFSIRPPERCTAAALRAEADGHDVTVRSTGKTVPVRTTVPTLAEFTPTA